MADDCLATWKSIAKGILKPQILPRHCPEEVTPNSTSKRDIWEASGPGASFLSRLWHVWPGGGPGAGAASLKLISNKTQPPESHQSEGEGTCDTLGQPQSRSAKPQSRPEAVCPTAPAPRGCQVA